MGTLTYSLGLGIRGTRIWGSKGRHLFHDHDQGGLEGAEGSGTFAPIIDGGTLQYADITMIPGSTLIMRNNGRINLAPGINFDVPKGVIINIESGEIN